MKDRLEDDATIVQREDETIVQREDDVAIVQREGEATIVQRESDTAIVQRECEVIHEQTDSNNNYSLVNTSMPAKSQTEMVTNEGETLILGS